MENLILLVHLLAALAIIGLILLQQGKGAEMGASFGSGASQTLFGASGSGNFFSKLTAIFAVVFFVTSFTLAVIAKQQASVDGDIPSLVESADEVPALQESASDIPVVEAADESSDLPEVTVPSDESTDLPVVEQPESTTSEEQN